LTLPAHTSLFSGLFPFRNGVRVNGTDRVPEGVPLLAAELSGGGFATAAFVSSLVLRRASGIDRGFNRYDDEFADNSGRDPRDFLPERRAEETVARAVEWIGRHRADKAARPFFVWVHLYDPHAPYEPPPPWAERFHGSPYEGEIAYADSCLARLLEVVDPGKTLVIAAGDHGESLGEHGEATHGVFLYDATVRVPLILRLPGSRFAGRRVTTQVSLTDLAPTVRRLTGLPPTESDGADLSPLFEHPHAPDRPAFSESDYPAFVLGWSPMRALRLHGRKFIEAPRRELYDLKNDPSEMANHYAGEDAAVRDLARPLATLVSRKPLAESTSSAADPEVAKKLASLGYISGGATAVDYARIDASRIDPKDHIAVWSQIESGLIARQKRNFEGAVVAFERLLASYPTINPVILRDYAEACRWTGRLDRSIELYERVLKTSRPEPDDFFGLGVAWHLKKEEAKACENFERAVAMDPSDTNSWIDLGNGRLALSQWSAAERAFLKAAALDPKSLDAVSGLAAVAFEKKDFAAAEEILRRALAIAPGHTDTRFNLALVEKALGRAEAARQIYVELASAADPAVAARARRELARLNVQSAQRRKEPA
jgi:choline-sulfatase